MLHKGINQDIIQQLNRSLLLKNLRKEGICSRAHLSSLTGLKQATITNIMKDFIYWELVNETGLMSGNKGRRSIGLTINCETYRIFGIQISRKFYKVGVFDLTGHTVEIITNKIQKHPNVPKVIDSICEIIGKLCKKYSNFVFLAAGVALPGPFISKKNRIALLVGGEEWEGINIKESLEKELKFPVFLEHDANAGAFRHMWQLKDSYQHEILVYISVGPGVGAGIVIDNQIYSGALGIAGEIGHTSIDVHGKPCSCGNKGCLDLYASSTAMLENINRAYKKDEKNELTLSDAKKMLQSNDAICLKYFEEACFYIGCSVANIVNTLNPDIIIIGDELSQIAPELMEKIVSHTVKSRMLPELYEQLSICVSKNEDDVILNGAAIIAINHIFECPELYMNNNTYTSPF